MTDNKFKSKQELDEYIKNNSTSFEEFEKKLDYSLFEKRSKKNKKHKGFSLKKLGYSLASLVLVIVTCLIIHSIYRPKNPTDCPYELGTYTYYFQEGNIDGLEFSEKSYIVLTDQELSGPGTFVVQDKDWVVYGKFYECEFESENIIRLNKNNSNFLVGEYNTTFYFKSYEGKNEINLYIQQNDKYMMIYLKN